VENHGRAIYKKKEKLQGVSHKTNRRQYKASKRRHFFVKHVGKLWDSFAMGGYGCQMFTEVPKAN